MFYRMFPSIHQHELRHHMHRGRGGAGRGGGRNRGTSEPVAERALPFGRGRFGRGGGGGRPAGGAGIALGASLSPSAPCLLAAAASGAVAEGAPAVYSGRVICAW